MYQKAQPHTADVAMVSGTSSGSCSLTSLRATATGNPASTTGRWRGVERERAPPRAKLCRVSQRIAHRDARIKDSAIVSRYQHARVVCTRNDTTRRRKGGTSKHVPGARERPLPRKARALDANGATGRCLTFRRMPGRSSICTVRNAWRGGDGVIEYSISLTSSSRDHRS